MGIATTVTLVILLLLPDTEPIVHRQEVENLSLCWSMARELVSRAEEGPLRKEGGRFRAGCEVSAPPSIDH